MKINTYVLSTADLDHKLIDSALEHDVEIDAVSFIQVESLREDSLNEELMELTKHHHTVVFTSANAINAMSSVLEISKPDWDIYCMGNATKKAVLNYFEESSVKGTALDGAALAAIIKSDDVSSVVFFCGDKRLDALPGYLYQNDVIVREIVVYKTKETPLEVTKHYQGIMFYSPNGVNSFFRLNTVGPHTVLFSIGNTTAAAIRARVENQIVVGDIPSKDHLVQRVIDHFQKK